MKRTVALFLLASGLAAQTPASKLCMTFDLNAGHKIPLPCRPSKLKAAMVRTHHALHVAGEVAIGAVIVGAYIYAKGH